LFSYEHLIAGSAYGECAGVRFNCVTWEMMLTPSLEVCEIEKNLESPFAIGFGEDNACVV